MNTSNSKIADENFKECNEDVIRAAIHKTKKKKSFDMFADDDDYNHENMGVAEYNGNHVNNEAENPHLIDNWDDAEGYYSTLTRK